MPRQQVTPDIQLQTQPSPFDKLPTHLALSMRTAETPFTQAGTPAYGQSGTAIEVPSCSSQSNTLVPMVDVRGSTSVIVKPLGQAGSSGDLQVQVSVGESQEQVEVADDTATTANAEIVEQVSSPTARPLVTQASVIVHTDSGQPISLSEAADKIPEEDGSPNSALVKKSEEVATEVAQEVQVTTSPPNIHSDSQSEPSTAPQHSV